VSNTNDGGPAFPNPIERSMRDFGTTDAYPGMSLRDYFAAKAMPGLVFKQNIHIPPKEMAKKAYAIADAMLAARGGGK